MSNVLLTCAGRRNYLVEYFLEALAGNGKVFAADCLADAAALKEADKAFEVPPIGHPDYCQRLLEICSEHDVALLVPLNDLELPLLADQKPRFEKIGTTVLVSSPDVVETCFDKWATAEFLARNNIPGPKTFRSLSAACEALDSGALSFPLVIKPRWGSASIGVETVFNRRELEFGYEMAKSRLNHSILASASQEPENILIQECLEGQEVGLDVINNLAGEHLCSFARIKLAMRSGETDRAETVDNALLSKIAARIGETLGHIGILDCDLFLGENSCYVLEMNPRFGGGYPFSHAAGANLPAVLLAWVQGRPLQDSWLRISPGVRTAKCDRLLVLNLCP